MTRSLRKRHLIMWVVITSVLAFLLVFARMNTPVFAGDTVTKEATP